MTLFTGTTPLLRAADADGPELQFFESKIRPLLVERCYKCHSAASEKIKGGLLLDSAEGLAKGGDDGPAVVAGHPEQSRLIEAVGYENVDLQMPPKAKLSDEQIKDLTRWVKSGANWPKEATTKPVAVAKIAFDLQQRKAGHWAWQPVKSQTPPAVKNQEWAKTAFDQFILAKLEANGLSPAVRADKRTLIRRAYFDLIGLPPSPQAVEEFLADTSPSAFEKVIDKLLDSPQYGERWARHWLDLVRYAETFGHEFDYPIAHAWQYRDYVIRALNADVPYNQFVTEHIAGDLLDRPRLHPTEGFNESIIGTGFWFFSEQTHAPVDVRQHQADRTDNQIDATGKAFLGLTLGCARCHDHKFDAISQQDVYALWGFAQSTRRQDALLDRQGKIGEMTSKLKALQGDGNKLLSNALPLADAVAKEVAAYLSAARDSSEAAHGLDGGRLKKWKTALTDKLIGQPDHPLYAWGKMSKLASDTAPAVFAQERNRVAAAMAVEAKKADESAAQTVLFKDFHDGNFNGWSVTGWAFGEHPTGASQWDSRLGGLRAVEPGFAHSGLLSPRLKGVLRSPTFTIEREEILYHAAGKGGQIHLVINGYMMDGFSGLLFSGTILKVDNEQLTWHRQAGDIGRYLGHSAYIEIIDDGDGWIGVDEIRFGGKGVATPTARPGKSVMALVADKDVDSIESLAGAYGRLLGEAVGRYREGKADAEQAKWVGWLLEHELLNFGEAGNKGAVEGLATISRAMAGQSAALPEPMRVLAAADGTGIDEHIQIRGNPKTPGAIAPRRFLEAIAGRDQKPITEGSGRLELARRLTDPGNPLFSRVIVNRIWHHLLGVGIVASTDNFGFLGERPTHPELLDFLAGRLVADGWSMKKLIREVMVSSTYQMSSQASDARAEEADPDDKLLHRARLRRLEGEEIRDEILSLSGRLDGTMFGPSVDVFLTSFMEGRGRPSSGPLDGNGRRSVYLSVRRNFLPPMMLAFDTPIPFSCMGRRSISNVPAQALILMNDPFVVQQAHMWAQRALSDSDLSAAQRVDRMYEAAFSRSATARERRCALGFMEKQGAALGIPPERREKDPGLWADLCSALMNTKEFIFLN